MALLSAGTGVAIADAPLHQSWIEVDVSACAPQTFVAPARPEYVAGDSYRTAVVEGKVHDTGSSGPVPASELAKITAGLLKAGGPVRLVLRAWDANVCKGLVGKTVHFRYDYSCDTWPRTSYCLPPLPLVDAPMPPPQACNGSSGAGPCAAPRGVAQAASSSSVHPEAMLR